MEANPPQNLFQNCLKTVEDFLHQFASQVCQEIPSTIGDRIIESIKSFLSETPRFFDSRTDDILIRDPEVFADSPVSSEGDSPSESLLGSPVPLIPMKRLLPTFKYVDKISSTTVIKVCISPHVRVEISSK